jgi:tRNA uridine 5-carboxymethylaminomethyl modification enzyme
MFTSRAEYRILLRQDNADVRLTPKGHAIGLADDSRMHKLEKKQKALNETLRFFTTEGISPEEINPTLEDAGSSPIRQQVKAKSIVARPEIGIDHLISGAKSISEFFQTFKTNIGEELTNEVKEASEILMKYDGYIDKEQEMAGKISKLENIKLGKAFDYSEVKSLSTEAREKLHKIRPETIGQAARISGVSPSDISVLMIYVGK